MPLVAHYPLQEDSGTTAYDVAGENNGTVNGATQGATGILGTSAYDFDGTDDYVLENSLSLTTPLTQSLWVYSRGGQMRFITNPAPPVMYIRTDSTNQLGMNLFDGSDNRYGTNTFGVTLPTDEWVHLAFVVDSDSGVWRGYMNGSEVGSGAGSGAITLGTGLLIGKARVDANYVDGRIADVRIYDHALTASEAQYLYSVSKRGSAVSGVKTI